MCSDKQRELSHSKWYKVGVIQLTAWLVWLNQGWAESVPAKPMGDITAGFVQFSLNSRRKLSVTDTMTSAAALSVSSIVIDMCIISFDAQFSWEMGVWISPRVELKIFTLKILLGVALTGWYQINRSQNCTEGKKLAGTDWFLLNFHWDKIATHTRISYSGDIAWRIHFST